MTNKEILKGMITERFLDNKISSEKYVKLSEKINLMKDEKAKEMIEEGGRKTVMSIAGLTIGLGPVGWAVYRTIRGSFDKCSEECGTYKINNSERQICMQKCKERMYDEMRKNQAKNKGK